MLKQTKSSKQLSYTASKPFEARPATAAQKNQVVAFPENYEELKEYAAERRAEKKAAERHAIGAKFFGKHYQPHKDWVKHHPLPSPRELFSDVRPTSTLLSPERPPLPILALPRQQNTLPVGTQTPRILGTETTATSVTIINSSTSSRSSSIVELQPTVEPAAPNTTDEGSSAAVTPATVPEKPVKLLRIQRRKQEYR